MYCQVIVCYQTSVHADANNEEAVQGHFNNGDIYAALSLIKHIPPNWVSFVHIITMFVNMNS
jgi:hypothetical protein